MAILKGFNSFRLFFIYTFSFSLFFIIIRFNFKWLIKIEILIFFSTRVWLSMFIVSVNINMIIAGVIINKFMVSIIIRMVIKVIFRVFVNFFIIFIQDFIWIMFKTLLLIASIIFIWFWIFCVLISSIWITVCISSISILYSNQIYLFWSSYVIFNLESL